MDWQTTLAEVTEAGNTWVCGRPALVMEFYGRGSEIAPHGEAILDAFLKVVPDAERGRLHVLSERSYDPLTAQRLRRIRKALAELPKRGRMYSITSDADCRVGEFSCELDLGNSQELYSDCVFVGFPLTWGHAEHVAATRAFFEAMLGTAPFWGAIAGFGYDMVWGREYEMAAMPVNFRLARRFQGLLVRDRIQSSRLPEPNPGGMPRARIPSAAWLTFLGKRLLDQVEGAEALQRKLPASIQVTAYRDGVIAQAGSVPPAGDANKQDKDVEPLRALHRAIQPVILGEWMYSHTLLGVDRDTASAWLHRFD